MTVPEAHAREMLAVYAFKGLGVEMDRTLPLREGEDVVSEGAVERYVSLLPRPAYLRLTSDRLCFLEHFLFRRDRVTEAVPTAIDSVSTKGNRVIVVWRLASGEMRSVVIRARSLLLVTPELPGSSADLATTITGWWRRHDRQ